MGDVPRYAPVVLAGHLLQVLGGHPDVDASRLIIAYPRSDRGNGGEPAAKPG